MRVIGTKNLHLPCGHHRVVLHDSTDPQPRICGTCRKRFTAFLDRSPVLSERLREDVYRVRFEEVNA